MTLTKAIMLLPLRTDWLRKNQIIWQHVTPWSLKECCLLKGLCRKQLEILHESNSRAKEHGTQHLLFSRIGVFICHCCSGELEVPAGSRWRSGKLTLLGFLIYIRERMLWPNGLNLNHVTPIMKRGCQLRIITYTGQWIMNDLSVWAPIWVYRTLNMYSIRLPF